MFDPQTLPNGFIATRSSRVQILVVDCERVGASRCVDKHCHVSILCDGSCWYEPKRIQSETDNVEDEMLTSNQVENNKKLWNVRVNLWLLKYDSGSVDHDREYVFHLRILALCPSYNPIIRILPIGSTEKFADQVFDVTEERVFHGTFRTGCSRESIVAIDGRWGNKQCSIPGSKTDGVVLLLLLFVSILLVLTER